MKHFTVCNIQFPECRRLPFSVVEWLFWHHERACMVMIETKCPVKIFALCVCWELFHPITPSVSSMWFLLSSTDMLHVLVFLFFVMISLIGNTDVRVLIYSVDRKPLQFPLIVHYLYTSCGASTKTIYSSWRLWSMGWFQVARKAQLYFSFWCTYIHLQVMQNPGKLIDEEGHQFHVSADTFTCKSVVKQISSQDHTPCQRVFGTAFTGTTFIETGARKLVW